MGEGRGEGENTAISSSYVPLPFIPSHQGRGNPTFYETVKVDALVKSPSGLLFRVKREIFILQPIEKTRFLPLVEMTH